MKYEVTKLNDSAGLKGAGSSTSASVFEAHNGDEKQSFWEDLN